MISHFSSSRIQIWSKNLSENSDASNIPREPPLVNNIPVSDVPRSGNQNGGILSNIEIKCDQCNCAPLNLTLQHKLKGKIHYKFESYMENLQHQ